MSDATSGPKNVIVFLIVLLVVGAGAAGVYLAESLYLAPMREQRQMLDNLKELVALLTKDVRRAEVAVTAQTQEPLRTSFKYVEVGEKGERVGPVKLFTIDGDVAYFDAMTIKFEEHFKPLDERVLKRELAAPQLASKAALFFRRVFGEQQRPEDGFPLDVPGTAPAPYTSGKAPSEFEKKLWAQFWELANDPALAKQHGVRAAHGQAVYMKLQKGKYYVIEQRLGGDLTIRAVEVPAVMRE